MGKFIQEGAKDYQMIWNYKNASKSKWFTTKCRKCDGTGKSDGHTCRRCMGSGQERVSKSNQEVIK